MYRQLDPHQPHEQLQKKRALIDQVVAASFPKDLLTNNFHSRENTALVTGLADLCANTVVKKLGKAACVVEADYGNMGGTNNLGRMLSGNWDDPTSGFTLTDGAAQIVGNMALIELREAHPEVQFTAVRSGGDEFRIFGFGIDCEQMRATLNDVVRPKMELFLAKAGLGEHPHSKAADDPNRNGFALAWGVGDLQDTLRSSYQIFKDADEEIKFIKKVIGYARHGNLIPEYEEIVRANVHAELSAGGQTPDPDEITRMTQERYTRAQQEVTAFAEKLQNVRPQVIDEEAVQRVMNSSEYAKYRPAMEQVEVPLAHIPYVGDERAVTADKVLEQRINTFCQDNDIEIADSERATFKLLVDNYRAINPVTGVDLPRDLPSRLELHARYTGPNGEKPRIMSVEFGNTAGFNDNISYGAADAVLRTQANIIKQALLDNDISANDVYDLGGGKFNVLTTPITEDQLKTIQNQIAEETQKQINSQTIESFFEDKRVPITDQERIKLVQAFQKVGVDVTPEEVTKQRISKLPHSKRPLYEQGVNVNMVSNELQKGVNGYDQMEEMKKDIERTIEKDRAEKLEAYNKQQQEKNNGQQGRGTQENVGGGSPENGAASTRVSIGGGDGRSVLQGSAERVGITSTQTIGPTVSAYVGQQNPARDGLTSATPATVNLDQEQQDALLANDGQPQSIIQQGVVHGKVQKSAILRSSADRGKS
ncbi:MAG: hypothetical protein EAY76_00910 [Alphaproteobacteria bacterium]|nr:MAG: hypothetical protein EAY76_00910 [Alphaproteobacteria bacterium]TAF76944.1 MAG: hypothetical protein EAZ52_02150 [Alphaproteobacteria bacterium]